MRSAIFVFLALSAREDSQRAVAQYAEQGEAGQAEAGAVQQQVMVAARQIDAVDRLQAAVAAVALGAAQRMFPGRHHVGDGPQPLRLDEAEPAADGLAG